jgi:hypothetical protein
MKNTIVDLRNHLFATLEALQDVEKPMELARAREIANVARVVVDSAKVEVAFVKATGALKSSDFLPTEEEDGTAPRRLPRAIGEAFRG